jgi:hypothetical protein
MSGLLWNKVREDIQNREVKEWIQTQDERFWEEEECKMLCLKMTHTSGR